MIDNNSQPEVFAAGGQNFGRGILSPMTLAGLDGLLASRRKSGAKHQHLNLILDPP